MHKRTGKNQLFFMLKAVTPITTQKTHPLTVKLNYELTKHSCRDSCDQTMFGKNKRHFAIREEICDKRDIKKNKKFNINKNSMSLANSIENETYHDTQGTFRCYSKKMCFYLHYFLFLMIRSCLK